MYWLGACSQPLFFFYVPPRSAPRHDFERVVRYSYATAFSYVPWAVQQVEAEALATKARKAAEAAAAAAAAEAEMSRRPRLSATRRFSHDSATGSGWDADGSVHGAWVRRGSSGSLSSSPVTRPTAAAPTAVVTGAREAEPLPNSLDSSPPGEAATVPKPSMDADGDSPPTPSVRESTLSRAGDTGGEGAAGEEVQEEQEDREGKADGKEEVASTKARVVTEKPPKTPIGASRGKEEMARSRWRSYNGSSASAVDRNSFEARAVPPRVESRADSSARSSAETGHRRPRSKSGSVVVDNEGLLVRNDTVRFLQPSLSVSPREEPYIFSMGGRNISLCVPSHDHVYSIERPRYLNIFSRRTLVLGELDVDH